MDNLKLRDPQEKSFIFDVAGHSANVLISRIPFALGYFLVFCPRTVNLMDYLCG